MLLTNSNNINCFQIEFYSSENNKTVLELREVLFFGAIKDFFVFECIVKINILYSN